MSTEVAPSETPATPATQGTAGSSPSPIAAAPRAANPLDLAPSEFREALARRSENRRALIEWIRASLVDGVDFGAVPLRRGGYSKPSLRKPGAEKICGMLGVTASFPTLKDYETAALEGRRLEQIILRCHLASPDGQIVADGVGARAVDQDRGDLNKSLKMAVKSAMIDATLRMAGLSEIFTQDLEDMPHGALDGDAEPSTFTREASAARPQSAARPRPARPSEAARHASEADRPDTSNGSDTGEARSADPREVAGRRGERLATERQVKLIRVRLERAGIAESELLERFGIPDIESLPFSKVSPALHWIDALAA